MTTRAQSLGVKPKQLQSQALRRIARMDKMAVEIAGLYGDVDNGVVLAVDLFRERLVELKEGVIGATDYLNEEQDT